MLFRSEALPTQVRSESLEPGCTIHRPNDFSVHYITATPGNAQSSSNGSRIMQPSASWTGPQNATATWRWMPGLANAELWSLMVRMGLVILC